MLFAAVHKSASGTKQTIVSAAAIRPLFGGKADIDDLALSCPLLTQCDIGCNRCTILMPDSRPL